MWASTSMTASDPPHPPQKQARSFGLIGVVSLRSPKPRPYRIGAPRTGSWPSVWTSKILSTVSGESKVTPRAVPSQAMML